MQTVWDRKNAILEFLFGIFYMWQLSNKHLWPT